MSTTSRTIGREEKLLLLVILLFALAGVWDLLVPGPAEASWKRQILAAVATALILVVPAIRYLRVVGHAHASLRWTGRAAT